MPGRKRTSGRTATNKRFADATTSKSGNSTRDAKVEDKSDEGQGAQTTEYVKQRAETEETLPATTSVADAKVPTHDDEYEARLLEMREDTVEWFRQLDGADQCVGAMFLRRATHPCYEDPKHTLRMVRQKMKQFLEPRVSRFFKDAKACDVAEKAVEYAMQSGFLIYELGAQRLLHPSDIASGETITGQSQEYWEKHPCPQYSNTVALGMSCFAPVNYTDEYTGSMLRFSARVRNKMWPHESPSSTLCDISGAHFHNVSWICGANKDHVHASPTAQYTFSNDGWCSLYEPNPRKWPFLLVAVGRMCIVSMRRRVGEQAFVGHAILRCSEMCSIMDVYAETQPCGSLDIDVRHFVGYLTGVLRERPFVLITSWLERTIFLALAHYLSMHAEDLDS
jgi:hypothetical protein